MLRWLLIAIFVVLGWIVLRFLATVLAPILAAMGIAYMLDPVLERLVRRGVPRMLGAAILLALCVTLIVGAVTIAAPRVYDQAIEFAGDLPRMLDNLSGWLHTHVGVEIPPDWKSYVTKEHIQGAFSGGPLRDLATAAVGGVFHLLGLMAEMLLIPVFGQKGFWLLVGSLGIACFGAALEITLQIAYLTAQGFGWNWSWIRGPRGNSGFGGSDWRRACRLRLSLLQQAACNPQRTL